MATHYSHYESINKFVNLVVANTVYIINIDKFKVWKSGVLMDSDQDLEDRMLLHAVHISDIKVWRPKV